MTARLAAASLIDPFEKDDAVLQEQIAQGHLPLAGVVAIALESRIRERMVERHGTVLRDHHPGEGWASSADRSHGPGALAFT